MSSSQASFIVRLPMSDQLSGMRKYASMGVCEANGPPLCAINARMDHHPKLVGATGLAVMLAAAVALSPSRPAAQSRAAAPQKQKLDAEYTAKIKEYLEDPRITT